MRLLIQIFWVENEVQIKSGIMIYVDVSVKIKLYVKEIIFGLLLNIQQILWIMCDEIIDADDEETKSIPKNFAKKKQPSEHKMSIFYMYFYQLQQHY